MWVNDYPVRVVRSARRDALEAFVRGYERAFRLFDVDFLYPDGGRGVPGFFGNRSDWNLRLFESPAGGYDLAGEIYRALKSTGKDKVFFCNTFNPLPGDLGFVEVAGGPWVWPEWRVLSDTLYAIKRLQPKGMRNGLLYWDLSNPVADRRFVNYLFALAYVPNNFLPHWEGPYQQLFDRHIPYVNGAYEIREAMLIDADLSPCWRREKTEIDAFSLRQGNVALIPVLNHYLEDRVVSVSADWKKLGLEPNRPAYLWTFKLLAPPQVERPDQPAVVPLQFQTVAARSGRLEVEAPVEAQGLTLLAVSQTPAFFLSLGRDRSQFRLSSTGRARVSESVRRGQRMLVVDTGGKPAELLVYARPAKGRAVTVDGRRVPAQVAQEAGAEFLRFPVPAGTHRIVLHPAREEAEP
jgi:hypothetical protein